MRLFLWIILYLNVSVNIVKGKIFLTKYLLKGMKTL